MNLFRVMEISGSALLAERMRAEIVSANLANAETTHTEAGGPYQRMHVVFGARPPALPSFGMTLASFADLHAEDVRVINVVRDGAAPITVSVPSVRSAPTTAAMASPSVTVARITLAPPSLVSAAEGFCALLSM